MTVSNAFWNRKTASCALLALAMISANGEALRAQTPAPVAPPPAAITAPPADLPAPLPVSLTPPAGPAPRINGPKVFGVRPNAPFLYSIPATGDRPMTFGAKGLPKGLHLDPATGRLTGSLAAPGEHRVTLFARNVRGVAQKPFRIVVGEDIALTPPMGWNSYNAWGGGINQDRALHAARAMVASGLSQNGWTYINMDEGWQGHRGGPFNAIQPNPDKFSDLPGMVKAIHAMGLKVGIYSSPWVTGYDNFNGGSSENPEGIWDRATMSTGPKNQKTLPFAIGKYHFAVNDAKQWAAWGMDYLKYDWNPIEVPETKEMYDALRATGRDFVYSLSNQTTFSTVPELEKYANSWRVGGDIGDNWESIGYHGFGNDRWAPLARPGHWNDPDMLEVGANGGGKPKRLTPDEQYTHISQWCLLSAPLLLGCDLDYLNPFTLGLLTNDEVLDVDQDTLGKQAVEVAKQGRLEVYAKPLDDGSQAVGLFNRGDTDATMTVNWADLKLTGKQQVRDLWRQKNLGVFADHFDAPVAPHGVELVKISAAK